MKVGNSKTQRTFIHKTMIWVGVMLIPLIFGDIDGVESGLAQESSPQVQVFTGRIEPDSRVVYSISPLSPGETLYVRAENSSGNLDPAVFLLDNSTDLDALLQAANNELSTAVAEGRDPMITLPDIYDRYTIAWNDDYGDNSAAAFKYTIPENGGERSYRLIVSGVSRASTFGNYRLLIGVDAPDVLVGSAIRTGNQIAVVDQALTPVDVSVDEVSASITTDQPKNSVTLRELRAGDRIYAYVEATSGDLVPLLSLENFNDKPLRISNAAGTAHQTSLEYTLDRDVQNYKIGVEGFNKNGILSVGEYRLIIGINAPQVLTGEAAPTERSASTEPIEVQVGATLQQITDVNQQAEKFSAVASLRLEWQDPRLAFNPDKCQCNFVTYTGDSFSQFADTKDILWPEFTFFNQQNNRWVQNKNVVVYADGRAVYLERFTTDFQAPLFNFVRFPFDEQQLYIQSVSVAPENYFTYTDPEEMSSIGNQLGEEEWYIVSSQTQILNEDGHASYMLSFNVRRHLNYYIFRIFLPIGLVLLVSWLTFWLKDFGKRVDVASANLLLFVAFNFTISSDLPRIGYLTFMDTMLIGSFIVVILVVLYNVILKRLETEGQEDRARRFDRPMIWLYPGLYIIVIVFLVVLFFR